MYRDFHAHDRWIKKQVHCLYQALIVAVATRHADATDIKFLVDGRPVWVALPLPAWEEYKRRAGKTITDALAIAIAGHFSGASASGTLTVSTSITDGGLSCTSTQRWTATRTG